MSALKRAVRQAGGDANVVALLSLKLLLLAFFILLNAMASYEEERTRAVIESLRSTFHGDTPAVAPQARYSAALGPLEEGGGPVEEAARLFRQNVPAVVVEAEQAGRRLRLTIPVAQLFRPGEVDLRADRLLLMQRLAKSLTQRGDFELQFLYPTTTPGNEPLPTQALEVRRAGRFARSMEGLGLPPRMLSVGVMKPPPGSPGGRVALELRRISDRPTPLAPSRGRGDGA